MKRCWNVSTIADRKRPQRDLKLVIYEDVVKDRPEPLRIVDEGLDVLSVTVKIADLSLAIQIDGKDKSR